MSTTTDLTTLKINYLTQAQYDAAKSQGLINDDELYLTPAADSGINDVTVDGVSVVTDSVAEITMPTIPTKVSDLTNDAGYITDYTETDPTVPSWAKASSKPSYTAAEVGAVPTSRTVNGKALSSNITLSASDVSALPSSTVIPSKTSDLTNDSGYITGYTETDPTVPNWAKQASKPTYTASEVGALPSTTAIPSKTSDLTNDSGFITGVTSTSTPTADTIAEFDGDAHMNSTDMTSQEVSDFVDSLDAQGSNIADYVVEQGTSGIWTYRKWNSGIAECWGTFTTSVTSSNFNQWGQVYSMNIAKQALPSGLFLSGSYPICTASGAMDYGDAWVSCSGNSTYEYTTPFLYERGSAPNASLSKAVTSVSVIGRWK